MITTTAIQRSVSIYMQIGYCNKLGNATLQTLSSKTTEQYACHEASSLGGSHLRMPATWAQGDAQRRVVRATPMRGRMGFSFLTRPGKYSLVRTPRMVGTSTTWKVLSARPCIQRTCMASDGDNKTDLALHYVPCRYPIPSDTI